MYKSKSLGKIHRSYQIMQGILNVSVSQTYRTSVFLVKSKKTLSIQQLWNTDEVGGGSCQVIHKKIYEITENTLRALTRMSSE